MSTSATTVDVRPAGSRFHTTIGWLDSWHSFSFGHHYDPANVGHGLLIVSNDDVIAPGAGFDTHPHRDMEIVTWVLEGAVEHRDSEGNHGIIRPGEAQRMSAGTGIRHSEKNASTTEPLHLVQMWVVPDTAGVAPGYEQHDVTEALTSGELIPVASGRGHEGAVRIHQRGAAFWAGELAAGSEHRLPDAPFVHVFVARGEVRIEGRVLGRGDAARLVATADTAVEVLEDAHVLVWESDAAATR